MRKERISALIQIACSFAVALLLAFIAICLISDNPMETARLFFLGPFTNIRYFGNMLETAIPLIFAGLSMCVVLSASQFNLAAEGIFFIAGILASAVGVYFVFPAGIHPLLVILAGGLVGMLVMLIPAILKAKLKASELLVSLMLNNIASGVGLWLLNDKFNDTRAAITGMPRFQESARLPVIIPGTTVHLGLVIALVLAVLHYIFLYRSQWGYEIRMVGINQSFAQYSGISMFRVIMVTYLLAGFIAGAGSAIENIGLHTRFEWSALPGYGLTGPLLALMAGNNPIGAIFSSLLIAYLRTGASLTSRLADVPAEMQDVLQGVIFVIMAVKTVSFYWKRKKAVKATEKAVSQ